MAVNILPLLLPFFLIIGLISIYWEDFKIRLMSRTTTKTQLWAKVGRAKVYVSGEDEKEEGKEKKQQKKSSRVKFSASLGYGRESLDTDDDETTSSDDDER